MSIEEYHKTKNTDVALRHVSLKHDDAGYFLSLVYRLEDDKSVELIKLPRVRLPLKMNDIKLRTDSDGFMSVMEADVGFGYTRLYPDKQHACYTIETVTTKTKEMTLEEIEKKLGHKVKIVSDKGGE